MPVTPVPAGLAERYPSLAWGEDEWAAALTANEELYISILDGIARNAHGPRRKQRA